MTIHAFRRHGARRERAWRSRRCPGPPYGQTRLALSIGAFAVLALGVLSSPISEDAPMMDIVAEQAMSGLASMASGAAGTATGRDGAVFDGDRIVIVDGDTLALPCAVPLPGCAEKLRLLDIDTPETYRPTCDRERVAGLRAKQRLSELVRGNPVSVTRDGKDRYGRTLATVRTPSGDVGARLLAEGLALPYRPGGAAKEERIRHWCG